MVDLDRPEVFVLPFFLGKTGKVFDFSNLNPSFQVKHICIQGSSMVVQMVPRIGDDLIGDDDILGYFKYDEQSTNYDFKTCLQ